MRRPVIALMVDVLWEGEVDWVIMWLGRSIVVSSSLVRKLEDCDLRDTIEKMLKGP